MNLEKADKCISAIKCIITTTNFENQLSGKANLKSIKQHTFMTTLPC